jgi:DNA repair photolyase
VGRDVDLFGAIVAKGGRVRVAVAIPVADEAESMVLEPRAPKPERRWLAVKLLSQAKVEVGLHLGPVVRSLNDGRAALTALLTQAKEAGATFVSSHPFDLPDAQREALVEYAAQSFPQRARDVRRLLAPSHRLEPKAFQAFLERLHEVRAEVGLDYLAGPTEAPTEPSEVETVAAGKGKRPQQLKLF